MPVVKFVNAEGVENAVEATVGESLMQAAMDNMVEGIAADCGGGCSCATCHIYVAPEWATKLEAPNEIEEMMLENVMDQKDSSRLSCQIEISDDHDGLVVHLPESQY
ncbi:2Fe-2S iron-sulfur cluster-binding protein [Maricurvus nonylphenolicus]|uniref:2Fe-2S iron-sulfur cluster-binding protein n=1 Tax=Maricurvus nonylphenolicus TaxID=1008307 RepID=UPI0036F28B7B